MCGSANSSLSWWLWMGGSIVIGVAAVATALSWNSIFNALIASVLVLSPTTQTYQRWVAPDQPLFFEVFMFNWTNADQFPREKPQLEQLGPYRFREVRKHVNVTFHAHNSSVAYRTQRSWFFDSETSNGSLHDTVTSINMIAASAMFNCRNSGLLRRLSLTTSFAFLSTSLSVTKTMGEMLFDGYEDSLLFLAKYLPNPDGKPSLDRFGWFYTRNNSIDTDGYVEITSGAGGNPLGQILKWNYQDSLPFYEGNCSKLAGSAGEFISQDLSGNSTLTMFVPDLCRTVHLDHVESGVMDGLNYQKFEMLDRCFDKSSVSDENNCFCNGECKWSGVMNVSACRFDAPAFLSLPHFLYADPALREAVDGMKPDPEKHSFYFSVEPTLGVPVDVAGRFQFNVYLEPSWTVGLFNNVPNMLFPVFWVQQHVKVTDDIINELRVVNAVARWGGLVFVIIGLTCAAIVIVCSSRKPKYISISTGWTDVQTATVNRLASRKKSWLSQPFIPKVFVPKSVR